MRLELFSVMVAGVLAVQTAPPSSQPPKKESTVQVRGCLHGQSLMLTEDPGFEVPDKRVDLTGDRRLMKMLKEHNGHLEEIVGVLKTQGHNTSVAVKEKRSEKTRVYVGVSDNRSKSAMEPLSAAAILDVRAFTHLGRKCQ